MKRIYSLITALILCVSVFTGCANSPGSNVPTEPENNIRQVLLSIDEAENPVYVTVENCAELADKEDMIHGTDIRGNGSGHIAEVFSCSDFGTAFFGSYDVTAEHLEKATFCFGVRKQQYAPITCGINYYDLIMDGTATDCESIRITYSQSVELRGVTGDFSIFLFPLSEDCPLQFGQSMITVSGTLAQTGDVALIWDGEKFTLTADTQITNCKAVTEGSDPNEKFIQEVDSSCTEYQITVTDGKPVITGGVS